MNIWNKVFLGVIFVAAIAVTVLASVEFHIRNTGQKKVADLERHIEKTDGEIAKIYHGLAPLNLLPDKSPSDWSFEEIRNAAFERYYERGRVWFDCNVDRINESTLPPALQQVEVQVIIAKPLPEGADEVVMPETLKGVVYVFELVKKEEGENSETVPGTFLGRFTVDSEPTKTNFFDEARNQKDGWRVNLVTADPISDDEIERIFDAVEVRKSRWAIYLTPPVDRVTGMFSQLTAEERQAIPKELRDRFLPRPLPEPNDTEGAEPGMNAHEIEPIQSFVAMSAMLDWLYQRRSTLNRDIEVAKSDIRTYETAWEKNEAENKKLENDGILEEKRRVEMEKQRDVVKDLVGQYEAEANRITLQIEKLQAHAKAYIDGIEDAHSKAAKKIEERTNPR
jgi:hypothetical protein